MHLTDATCKLSDFAMSGRPLALEAWMEVVLSESTQVKVGGLELKALL